MNRDTRELLFQVAKKDFKVTTFRGSGPGGQHRNKTDSGVRIVHAESGARAEATEDRSQHVNRKVAFARLRETPEWKSWFRVKVAESMMTADDKRRREAAIEEAVRRAMAPGNILAEVQEEGGRWVEADFDSPAEA